MGTRRCGYCRDSGHVASKCAVKSEQRHAVQVHHYHERLEMYNLLLRNGYGIGCLLQDPSGEVYTIRSMKASIAQYGNSVVDWRPIKYRKSVRATLHSYSGICHTNIKNDLVRYDNMAHMYINCCPLNDLGNSTYGIISLTSLEHQPTGRDIPPYASNYYRERHMKVLAPSQETDVTPEVDFMERFYIHERLGRDRDGRRELVMPIKLST